MMKRSLMGMLPIFALMAMAAPAVMGQEARLRWQAVAPGVWSAHVGVPETIDLLKAAGGRPEIGALRLLGSPSMPAGLRRGVGEVTRHDTIIRLPIEADEQLFGFGLNFKNVRQRKRIFNLHVDHYGNADNGRTHAPVPFYISNRGYGILINSARYLRVYAGTGLRKDSPHHPKIMDRNTDRAWEAQPDSDVVEVLVPAGGVVVYLFAGPTMMDVVRRYNLYNGGGAMPPKWGLGFTQRVPTLLSEREVRLEVDEFDRHGFPLDFVGLEPGWQSKSYPCTFDWDRGRFPDPARFTREMLGRGVRLNLWLNPYVSPDSPIYDQVKPFTATHTVWNGLVPDFLLPGPKRSYRQFFVSNHLGIGVSGYKIDEVDGGDQWLWPDVARFPSGHDGEQMRQIYGLLLQRETLDWFRTIDRRTWGLVRGSNGGASSFPYVIYNDNYDHRDFITALVNSSFIGVLWTPEVRASKTAEEWLRRMQAVCFSPMAMINAWADGTKPWSYPEVERQVREAALLRMRLLPYIYTTFAQYRFEGKPPIRAMYLVDGFDDGGIEAKDQFMLGDSLLVAPAFAGQTTRKVRLPRGRWYDFHSGEYAGQGETIEVKLELDRIPLFVRDGAIIPMIPERLRAPRKGEVLPLEIRYYGTADGRFDLYDDDGESFAFERGEHSWTRLEVVAGEALRVAPGVSGRQPGYDHFKWVFKSPRK